MRTSLPAVFHFGMRASHGYHAIGHWECVCVSARAWQMRIGHSGNAGTRMRARTLEVDGMEITQRDFGREMNLVTPLLVGQSSSHFNVPGWCKLSNFSTGIQ
jgi:hypothetical protein